MNAFNNKRNFFRVAKDKSLSFLLLLLASCTSVPVTNRSGKQDPETVFKTEESYIRPYHHLPDGTFRNPEGSIEREDYEFPWFKFTKERMSIKVKVPEDHVVPKDKVLPDLAALENEDTITWIGHVTFLIRLGGKTIITDPFFSPNAGPLALGPRRYIGPAIKLSELPKTDLLLLTHNHYDHLDEEATKNFPHKKVKVLCPLKLSKFYKDHRFRDVSEMDWYQEKQVDDLKITFLPAVHWSKRELFDRNRTLWGSYLIEYQRKKILFCCDTATGEVYKKLGREYGPIDIAFINIGAYEPVEIMKYSHANPAEALEIGRNLRAKKIVGTHWGTILMSLEDPFEPPAKFLANAKNFGYQEKDAVLFKIGETKTINQILS
jgi:L-ascorbate metabolism protein UlaG (beta-lactamase superfamily)